MAKQPIISFVIPAFNEQKYIKNTLELLHKYSPPLPYEVLIVDNGSTDDTAEIATFMGDTVLSCPDGTIAKVRNTGVHASKGNILIFLDADVELTLKWQQSILSAIQCLEDNPLQITGSRCLPPNNKNSLNIHWFNQLGKENSTTYINSGHLITTKLLFDKISGFNNKLKTAEDHDFCIRAKKCGAKITPNPELKVIHDGYPVTFCQFLKRERWHGREDFKTLTSLIKSKIAWIICFHLILIITSFAISYSQGIILGFFSYLVTMLITTIGLTKYKFNDVPIKSLIKTSFIHYLYIIGRTHSLIDRLTFRYAKKFR